MASFKRGLPTIYRRIRYRSKWEVYVAKLLFYNDICFQYEPKRFFFNASLSYLPDFYLPRFKSFLEVKGILTQKDKLQIRLLRRQHRVIYIGKEELKHITDESLARISRMNVVEYKPNNAELYRFRRFLEDARKN